MAVGKERTRILVVDELSERNKLERVFASELPDCEVVGVSTVGTALFVLGRVERFPVVIINDCVRYGVGAECCNPQTDQINLEGGLRLLERIRQSEERERRTVLMYIIILTDKSELVNSKMVRKLLGQRGEVWVKPCDNNAFVARVAEAFGLE